MTPFVNDTLSTKGTYRDLLWRAVWKRKARSLAQNGEILE